MVFFAYSCKTEVWMILRWARLTIVDIVVRQRDVLHFKKVTYFCELSYLLLWEGSLDCHESQSLGGHGRAAVRAPQGLMPRLSLGWFSPDMVGGGRDHLAGRMMTWGPVPTLSPDSPEPQKWRKGKRCPLCVCGKCVCTHVYTWERCFRSGNKRFMTHLSSDFLQGCGIKARDNEVEVAKLDQDFCKNKDIRGLIKIMKLKQTKLWGPSPKGLTLI